MKTRFMLLAMVTILLSGCGYTLQGGGSVLPPDVRRIYIPLVENNSAEAGLTTMVTEALRDRFDRYGVVTVVDDIGDADAILKARILKVKRETSAVTSKTDSTLRYDATMTIAAELRRVSGPVLWRNANLAVTRSYGAAAGGIVTTSSEFFGSALDTQDLNALEQGGTREVARGAETEALNFLADKAAQSIYDSAVAPDF